MGLMVGTRTGLLFLPGEMYPVRSEHWVEARDGDVLGLAMYRRHYSCHRYRDGRDPALFVGPGEKTVLLHADGSALFVWRKFISGDGQEGVNCAVFRNEGDTLSSVLILEAHGIAWERWPGERLYTYVNPRKVQSANPGYCFIRAGWRRCGVTKGGLLVLEMRPEWSGR
jgi:hypothetical protein